MREGSFEKIIMKLEKKGRKNNIYKYKEMQQLRAKRNKKYQSKLEEYGPSKSVLDSSTVTAGLLIQRHFRKLIASAREKIKERREREGAADGSGA